MHRVARVSDHERVRLDGPALGARRRSAAEEEPLQHRCRRRGILAHRVEPHIHEVVQMVVQTLLEDGEPIPKDVLVSQEPLVSITI